jgi:murein tripeptide amidase MpaA
MLNPDGVIVGNYRTNLAAKDLNRTYMNPKKVGTKMRCLKRRVG